MESLKTRELNVIGYRVDDALSLIEKAIDCVLVDGQPSLRIIHGYGTGRLRNAIRKHLRGFPSVKRCFSEDPQSGGDAVTIVEFS